MAARFVLGVIATIAVAGAVQAASPTTPQPGATAGTAAGDKVRCKRYTETGSLAKVRKECHTVAEWDRMAQDARTDVANVLSRSMAEGQKGQ